MMKDDKYKKLSDLVLKSIKDNTEENEELRKILSENGCSEDLINHVSSKEYFINSHQMLHQAFEHREEKELLFKIKQRNLRRIKVRRTILGACGGIAAALLAISFYLLNPDKEEFDRVASSVVVAKIEKPTLIIDDSDYIELNDKNKHTVAKDYSKKIGTGEEHIANQRLIIPVGNTYSVLLEDGSEVLLNANSELIYPSKFIGNERRVELRGEAFFTVKKGDKPFIVNVNNSFVRVYGTSFNINANDKNVVKTILVEGSVGIGMDEASMTLIKPNQLGTIDVKNKTQNITDINVDNYLAWKTGLFKFIDTDFDSMINELENWYGKKFQYNEDSFKKVKVNFSISRSNTVEETLKFMQTILKINITEEGGAYHIERKS